MLTSAKPSSLEPTMFALWTVVGGVNAKRSVSFIVDVVHDVAKIRKDWLVYLFISQVSVRMCAIVSRRATVDRLCKHSQPDQILASLF